MISQKQNKSNSPETARGAKAPRIMDGGRWTSSSSAPFSRSFSWPSIPTGIQRTQPLIRASRSGDCYCQWNEVCCIVSTSDHVCVRGKNTTGGPRSVGVHEIQVNGHTYVERTGRDIINRPGCVQTELRGSLKRTESWRERAINCYQGRSRTQLEVMWDSEFIHGD